MDDQNYDNEPNTGITAGASFTMHGNFRVFARAIMMLNRVGEELYLEPNEEGLALRALNSSKSAYATFLFSSTFFISCDLRSIKNSDYNLCRISMKCALSAFRSVKSCDKSVLSCRLFINPKADSMLVQLTHTYDVIKSHEISFLDCTTAFRNVVNKSDLADCVVASSFCLSNLFLQIRQNSDEIMLCAKPDSFIVRNYTTRELEPDKIMKTEMKISTTDFERYNIPKATEVTVNLKEFRALVHFAETYQAPISVYFDQPGSPMVLALESDVNFTVELVIATVDFDSSIIEPNFCTAAVESSNEIECASSLRQSVSSSVQQNAQKPIETQSQNRLSSLNSQMLNQQPNHSHNQPSTSLQHQNQSPQQISHDRRYSTPSPKSAPNQSQHDHRTHLPQTPPPPQPEAPDNTVLSQAVVNQKSKSQSFAHGSVATSTVTMPPSSSNGTVESVKATNGHDEGSSVKKRCLRESNENENRNEISHSTVVENSVVENTINNEGLYPNNNADSDKDDDDDVEMFPESPSPPPSKSYRHFFLGSSQTTQHASQLFRDKPVIAPNTQFDDELL